MKLETINKICYIMTFVMFGLALFSFTSENTTIFLKGLIYIIIGLIFYGVGTILENHINTKHQEQLKKKYLKRGEKNVKKLSKICNSKR